MADDGKSAARPIDEHIAVLGDWRGETLASVRTIDVHAAEPVASDALTALIHAAVSATFRAVTADTREAIRH